MVEKDFFGIAMPIGLLGGGFVGFILGSGLDSVENARSRASVNPGKVVEYEDGSLKREVALERLARPILVRYKNNPLDKSSVIVGKVEQSPNLLYLTATDDKALQDLNDFVTQNCHVLSSWQPERAGLVASRVIVVEDGKCVVTSKVAG